MLTVPTHFSRGGQDSSAFSSSSIIMELRQQVTQLQNILTEKEEMGRAAAQKLASYQQHLHTKNEEVASLKDELHTKVLHIISTFQVQNS